MQFDKIRPVSICKIKVDMIIPVSIHKMKVDKIIPVSIYLGTTPCFVLSIVVPTLTV